MSEVSEVKNVDVYIADDEVDSGETGKIVSELRGEKTCLRGF